MLPLAVAAEGSGGLISAELATVVIGGLMSSTGLTLIALPIVYLFFNESLPNFCNRILRRRPLELAGGAGPGDRAGVRDENAKPAIG